MKITREHYKQLSENFKATRHLMSDADCETMRKRLNEMRKSLAFEACLAEWRENQKINCYDFLQVCATVGIDINQSVHSWIMSDIIEVGAQSYSCIGKIHKTKEKTLNRLCEELSIKIKNL